jgi:hypothetical protein
MTTISTQNDNFILLFLFLCNRGDNIQYHGGLRSRELCQAPMLLVFLTPRQALSSHPCISIMIFIQINNFFKLPAMGIEPLTLGLQVQCSPSTPRELLTILFIKDNFELNLLSFHSSYSVLSLR